MTNLNPNLILYPVFALVSLVFIVTGYLGFSRNKAVKEKAIGLDHYKLFNLSREPENLIAISRNYSNLYESPVLFYVVVIFFYLMMKVDLLTLSVAWIYVISRYLHTVIHLGHNNVMQRFFAFITSQACLAVLWIKLFCVVRV